MSKKKIDTLRKTIDKLDMQLLYLLNERAESVIELGKIKNKMKLKVFDPKRERDIFVKMTEKNPGPLHADAIVRIFERIIDESRRLERIEAYKDDKES
ncbi:MAG: chorismate mutase [Calditrichaeota bacterium]|nr:MAG: chorismate mutase [Calditrichota bacterium]